jgi:hypothetical protein
VPHSVQHTAGRRETGDLAGVRARGMRADFHVRGAGSAGDGRIDSSHNVREHARSHGTTRARGMPHGYAEAGGPVTAYDWHAYPVIGALVRRAWTDSPARWKEPPPVESLEEGPRRVWPPCLTLAGHDPERAAYERTENMIPPVWREPFVRNKLAQRRRRARLQGSALEPSKQACGSCRRIAYAPGQIPAQHPNGRWHHPACHHMKGRAP